MTRPSLPGQPHIAYNTQQLMVEGVAAADLAQQHGTPLFVYSKAAMLGALAAYQRGAVLLAYCRGKLEAVQDQIKVLDNGQLKPWASEE